MTEKTFGAWMVEDGRSVRAGEKAQHYLRNPRDPQQRKALFTYDQTEPFEEAPTVGWERVAADELRPKGPKAEITYDGQETAIWTGNNKKAIAYVRAKKYVFSIRDHRWRKTVSPYAAAGWFMDHGYRVVANGFDPLDTPPPEPTPAYEKPQTPEAKLIERRDTWFANNPPNTPLPGPLHQQLVIAGLPTEPTP